MSLWARLALATLLSALQLAIKNPGSIAKEKAALLEVQNTINALFPGE